MTEGWSKLPSYMRMELKRGKSRDSVYICLHQTEWSSFSSLSAAHWRKLRTTTETRAACNLQNNNYYLDASANPTTSSLLQLQPTSTWY